MGSDSPLGNIYGYNRLPLEYLYLYMVRIIKNCSSLIEDLLLVKEYSELEQIAGGVNKCLQKRK